MNTRLQIHLKCSAFILFITTLFITSVPVAQAEEAILFRSTDVTITNPVEISRSFQRKTILKLDEKGDLLFLCSSVRFTVSYKTTADPFKPSFLYETQRGSNFPTIGVSLSVSLVF